MPSRTSSSLVVFSLAFGGIAAAVTQTMITPLIAGLPEIFHTPASNTAWVVTATLLAGAVSVPILGRLGDIFGKRRMLLVSAVPLLLGGIVCAVSPTVEVMILGRAMQGVGMAMIPLGIALIRDSVPPERLSSAIATVSATLGVGGAIGTPLSAAVIQFAHWRVLFVIGAAVTLVAMVLVWRAIPEPTTAPERQPFDLLGAIGMAVGLVALILAVSKGTEWGWSSPLTLGLLIGAALVFALWGAWELRHRAPLVDLRTTVRPRVLLTNLASVFIGFGMYASMLVMPQVLQLSSATGYGLGQSVLAAGLWMAPGGVMMMVLSPLAGRLTDAKGPKFTLTAGVLVIAAGYLVALFGMGSPWGLAITGIVVYSGVALAYGSMPALIMSAVPATETAAANGFNSLMRSLGTTVGATVVGVVLSHMTHTYGGVVVPSEEGFRMALILGCAVSLLAAGIAAVIPVTKVRRARRRTVEPLTT